MLLRDGWQTLITFSENPTIEFVEKTVKPPGFDGGGPNETSTMRNTRMRTQQPKSLITLTESTLTVAYDPACYESIPDIINVNQLITLTFPDGSEVDFWGWLNTFNPNEHTEGEQPTAEVQLLPSNQNNDMEEVLPVYRAPA